MAIGKPPTDSVWSAVSIHQEPLFLMTVRLQGEKHVRKSQKGRLFIPEGTGSKSTAEIPTSVLSSPYVFSNSLTK